MLAAGGVPFSQLAPEAAVLMAMVSDVGLQDFMAKTGQPTKYKPYDIYEWSVDDLVTWVADAVNQGPPSGSCCLAFRIRASASHLREAILARLR